MIWTFFITCIIVYLCYEGLFGERDMYEKKKKEQEDLDRFMKLHEQNMKNNWGKK